MERPTPTTPVSQIGLVIRRLGDADLDSVIAGGLRAWSMGSTIVTNHPQPMSGFANSRTTLGPLDVQNKSKLTENARALSATIETGLGQRRR
jgi:hypothetical protein